MAGAQRLNRMKHGPRVCQGVYGCYMHGCPETAGRLQRCLSKPACWRRQPDCVQACASLPVTRTQTDTTECMCWRMLWGMVTHGAMLAENKDRCDKRESCQHMHVQACTMTGNTHLILMCTFTLMLHCMHADLLHQKPGG